MGQAFADGRSGALAKRGAGLGRFGTKGRFDGRFGSRKVPVSWAVPACLVARGGELYNPKTGQVPFIEENRPLALCGGRR